MDVEKENVEMKSLLAEEKRRAEETSRRAQAMIKVGTNISKVMIKVGTNVSQMMIKVGTNCSHALIKVGSKLFSDND